MPEMVEAVWEGIKGASGGGGPAYCCSRSLRVSLQTPLQTTGYKEERAATQTVTKH